MGNNLSNNTSGNVLEANCRLALVSVLTTRTRRLEGIHLALPHEFFVRQFQVPFTQTFSTRIDRSICSITVIQAPEQATVVMWMLLQ